VEVCNSRGERWRLKADFVVLANGGFGVPQLLLQSTSPAHPMGLGNAGDAVGRYYMDHSHVLHGRFAFDPAWHDPLRFYDLRSVQGVSVIGSVGLSEELKDRHGLNNLEAMLFPTPSDRDRAALNCLREVIIAGRERRAIWGEAREHAQTLWAGLPYLTYVAWQRWVRGTAMLMPGLGIGGWSAMRSSELKRRYPHLELMSTVELKPRSDNRVTLGETLDALGQRRIRVNMDWAEADLDSIARSEELLVGGLQARGLGHFTSYRSPEGRFRFFNPSSHHLMGTARMGLSPADSVVDRDCRIHGLRNAYVASSAVFRTGGYANPTMTILALALRLADTLRRELA
jgi:choline dehydrogenase-like flavoprotein